MSIQGEPRTHCKNASYKTSQGHEEMEDMFRFIDEAIEMQQWPKDKVVCMTTSDNVGARGTVINDICSGEGSRGCGIPLIKRFFNKRLR